MAFLPFSAVLVIFTAPRRRSSGNSQTLKKNSKLSIVRKHLQCAGFGDKFGESLGGSRATPSFWEVPGLPRKFPKLPRKFFGDFPRSSLTVELYTNPEVPRKFPGLPRKFPRLPRKFPGLPRRSALSLGSLTPSPDSQKLSLRGADSKLMEKGCGGLDNVRCSRMSGACTTFGAIPEIATHDVT